jgi:hypothetical protein
MSAGEHMYIKTRMAFSVIMDVRSKVLDMGNIHIEGPAKVEQRDVERPAKKPKASLSILSGSCRGMCNVRIDKTGQCTDWPAKTDVYCYWCCHPFDSTPLPMPHEYDELRDIFKVSGNFCSWACMKSYNGKHTGYRSPIVSLNILLMKRRLHGKMEAFKGAPPREKLRIFGGSMSVEEFRNVSPTMCYEILPRNMIHEPPNLVEHEEKARRLPAAKKDMLFKGVSVKNEPLRLKRDKPTATHKNTLEKAMGIRFFTSNSEK